MKLSKTQIFITTIICSVVLGLSIKQNADLDELQVNIIDVNGGYGYEIIYNNRVIIKQEQIPAIDAKKPFLTKEDSKKVASIVIEHLKSKEMPYIKIKDLESLQIKF